MHALPLAADPGPDRSLIRSCSQRPRGGLPGRATRVTALVCVIVLLSAFDLLLTLTYAAGGGFAEANPVARVMLREGTPASLAIWKACTVLPCVLTLLLGRAHRSAEVGAWAGVVVLGCLAVHWTRYIEQKATIADLVGPYDYREVFATDPDWVELRAAPKQPAWLTHALP
ncbi:MAG: DUF5658 family protein [Planctomycetota bacterium]